MSFLLGLVVTTTFTRMALAAMACLETHFICHVVANVHLSLSGSATG